MQSGWLRGPWLFKVVVVVVVVVPGVDRAWMLGWGTRNDAALLCGAVP